jgi:hypothetical protein
MNKPIKKGGAVPPQYREIAVCELDQIRGGTVIVTDPGPGDDEGSKKLAGTTARSL